MTDWLTSAKAAEILGVSLPEMQRKLWKGIIPSEWHGRARKIDPAVLEEYKKNPRKPGNPRIKEQKIWELTKNEGNPEIFKESPNWKKSQQKSQRRKRRAKRKQKNQEKPST